jgi:NAD(P)-dependent dehydrogenase (short-subunit alcohol dehydrogenase family)
VVEKQTVTMRSVNQLLQLHGRKAIVTGGAGHIGLAIDETLLELGASVVILDSDASACETRVAELSHVYRDKTAAVVCDLADEVATRSAVQKALAQLGGLDILVHCAAYVGTTQVPGWAVPFEKQTVQAWDAALRVNLTSAFVMAQEAKPALAASGHSSVIFISSIYGLVGPDMRLYDKTNMANPAAYGVSKAGLLQLVRYLATTLAPEIRVNAITPGGVWREQPQSFVDQYVSRTPLARMGTEEDFKGAIAYLASDLSNYVTGQNLIVDGGWTAW